MSLFSFQDIISCVTGIMVLTTLLLALELTQRKAGPPDRSKAVGKNIAEMTARRDKLRDEVSENSKTVDKLGKGIPVDPIVVESKEKAVKSLFLANKILASEQEDAIKKGQALQKEASTAENDVKQMAATIARLEARLTTLPGKVFGKQAMYVECSAGKCLVVEVMAEGANTGMLRQVAQFAGPNAYDAFRTWVQARAPNSGKEAYILLVRPEAVTNWQPTVIALASAGFDVGWDVWPGDRKLMGKN